MGFTSLALRNQQRYALVGEVCQLWVKLFPARRFAWKCEAPAKEPVIPSPAWAKSIPIPPSMTRLRVLIVNAPYMVALVGKAGRGPFVTAQLTDMDFTEVSIGMPVEMVTQSWRTDGEEGMIVHGITNSPPRWRRPPVNGIQ